MRLYFVGGSRFRILWLLQLRRSKVASNCRSIVTLMGGNVAKITIDEIEYETEELSEEAQAQLQALQATDRLILEAQQQLAILQTARNAYAAVLRGLLD